MKKATLVYLYFLGCTTGITLAISIPLRLFVNWLVPGHPMDFWDAWFFSIIALMLFAVFWRAGYLRD